MINLKNYMLALKSTWIRRLIVNTSKYVSIFETMYTEVIPRGKYLGPPGFEPRTPA